MELHRVDSDVRRGRHNDSRVSILNLIGNHSSVDRGGFNGGLVCVAIGGAINAYRIYAIILRANDEPSQRAKGAVGGFVTGAIVFGLPLWGLYLVVQHLAGTWLHWTLFAVLAFGFGLGMWEFLEIERSKKLCGEHAYRSNLPLSFSWLVFKLWKFIGQCGVIIVPAVAWSRGFPWAIGAEAAFIAAGAAIGFGIQWSIEASVRRSESASE